MDINNKEEKRKEEALKKYFSVRDVLIQICREKNISYEEYMGRYPDDVPSKITEFELNGYIQAINKDLRLLLNGLYLEDWKEIIYQSFDKSHHKDTIELINATIKCDPSNMYKYFSRTADLLKLLGNEKTKESALIFLEKYCETHIFEDLLNNYDLVFRSKYAKEVSEARDRGWANSKTPGFGERKREKASYYFRSSKKDEYKMDYDTQMGCDEQILFERIPE